MIVIDLQPKFLTAICEAERVVDRTLFLARVASLLGIPVLGTAQNPARLGTVEPRLTDLLTTPIIDKMSFSVLGEPSFHEELRRTGRRQVVLVGVETHICVSHSCGDLLNRDYAVVVCPDAVSSRTMDRHKLGMERIRDSGAMPAHTESVAYEWLGSASHPKFREALAIVKESTH